MAYNCQTYTLPTNTCKHNNNGVLSDVISFSNPIEKNYLDILNQQEILKISEDFNFKMLTPEENIKLRIYSFLWKNILKDMKI